LLLLSISYREDLDAAALKPVSDLGQVEDLFGTEYAPKCGIGRSARERGLSKGSGRSGGHLVVAGSPNSAPRQASASACVSPSRNAAHHPHPKSTFSCDIVRPVSPLKSVPASATPEVAQLRFLCRYPYTSTHIRTHPMTTQTPKRPRSA
jgi:hypothetical protein